MTAFNTDVANLKWAITSPSLLTHDALNSMVPEAGWYTQAFKAFETFFKDVERQPSHFEQFLQTRRTTRLGHYFEALWSFFLRHNDRYELLGENIQIQGHHNTLGEVDFLVRDRLTDQIEHWEVAVKFYVAYGPSDHIESWYGVRANDSLQQKINRLTQHQCSLLSTKPGLSYLKEQKLTLDTSRVLMKGRLFYASGLGEPPDIINPRLERGWWMTVDEFVKRFDDCALEWCALDKRSWLAPSPGHSHTTISSVDELTQGIETAVCVVGYRDQAEVERGFVIPNDWLKSLKISL